MPAVAAAAAISAISVSSVAGALTIGFSLSTFAGSLILGGLSYALTPKPKKPSFNPNDLTNKGSTVAVRQPDLTRQFVYGHTRITRGYAHMESTGANGVLHMILMLCEGPVRAINEVWINDYPIPNDWIGADGKVTQGRYAGFLTIRKHLGTETQGADPLAVSNMSTWTNDCRLAGIAYIYLIMTKDQDVYPTGVPNVSAVVEGMNVYDPRLGTESWSSNIALFARDYLRNDRYGFGVFEDDIDDVNTAAQANICDEIVTTQDYATEVTAIDGANNLLTLIGEILPYQFGDRVSVSSTGTLPTGLNDSDYYYVIPYQIKGRPRIGLAESLQGAMDKDYVDFASDGTGTMTVTKNGEPRYHGSGVIDTESPLSETLNNIVSSMAGRAVCIGGFWTLLAGSWRTPALTLGISDMRSEMSFKNALTMAESFNVVKGLFVSSTNLYQQSDYPSAVYQEFINQDNGLESPKELNLPFTNRATTATRIAKIELFRGRQDIVYKSSFSTKALQLQPGDNTALTIDRLGWDEKEFEVTEFSFDIADGSLITKMTLRETAEAIFDWGPGDELTSDIAPNTNLPNPFVVTVPTGVGYNSRVIDTNGGDELYMLTLQWDEHPDAFVVEYGDFEVQFKLSSEVQWRPSFFVDGALTQTDVSASSVNIFYDLRIRARNNLGVRSPWVTILSAVAGSSGGVGTTYDYELVTDSVSIYNDWGGVSDAPLAFEDWGYVI